MTNKLIKQIHSMAIDVSMTDEQSAILFDAERALKAIEVLPQVGQERPDWVHCVDHAALIAALRGFIPSPNECEQAANALEALTLTHRAPLSRVSKD